MNHPVFTNLRASVLYFLSWLFVAIIHFGILFFYYRLPVSFAVTDSLLFNSLFCLLGLAVWFPVRFTQPDKSPLFNLFINHLSSLSIILLIWLGIGISFMNYWFDDNKTYYNFIHNSISWRLINGLLYYFILVLIYYLNIYYHNLQSNILRENRLKEMMKEAELNLLKSQINPHFLFNSLNSVSSLTMTNPAKAQEMIIRLSDFLRYTVTYHEDSFTSLEKEIENITRYLDIEKIRFGAKLQYKWDVGTDCLQIKIPIMILQPIFENAIKHGVYESTGTVEVQTTCKFNKDFLLISIKNNFEQEAIQKRGAGIGLKNIRERLTLIYDNNQLLKTFVDKNTFITELIIPIKTN